MNTLPEDIKETIYKYKHQIEFNNVINELTDFVCFAHACILLKLAYCSSLHRGLAFNHDHFRYIQLQFRAGKNDATRDISTGECTINAAGKSLRQAICSRAPKQNC